MCSWEFMVFSSSHKWDLGSWQLCQAVPHLGAVLKDIQFLNVHSRVVSSHIVSTTSTTSHGAIFPVQLSWLPSQRALFNYSLLCLSLRTTLYAHPVRAYIQTISQPWSARRNKSSHSRPLMVLLSMSSSPTGLPYLNRPCLPDWLSLAPLLSSWLPPGPTS